MNIWQRIHEAQSRRIGNVAFEDDGHDVQILIHQNGWYEGFVSMS